MDSSIWKQLKIQATIRQYMYTSSSMANKNISSNEMVQEMPDQLAQASWFLQAEVISLAQVSWLLVWASDTLKFFKNDPYALQEKQIQQVH